MTASLGSFEFGDEDWSEQEEEEARPQEEEAGSGQDSRGSRRKDSYIH